MLFISFVIRLNSNVNFQTQEIWFRSTSDNVLLNISDVIIMRSNSMWNFFLVQKIKWNQCKELDKIIQMITIFALNFFYLFLKICRLVIWTICWHWILFHIDCVDCACFRATNLSRYSNNFEILEWLLNYIQ